MHDLIIIGAGPAGLTAGLYAGRYRLDTVMLEAMSAGGQIMLSATIENYPGFPGGILTQDLIQKIIQQMEDVGVRAKIEKALEIIFRDDAGGSYYTVKSSEMSYDAKSVILACGARAKKLGVEGEESFIGRGVSYCGTCDGPLFKNKDIVVVGGGDKAVEEALYLTSYARKVTLIHRRDQLRASEILQEKARKNKKIEFMFDAVVEKISGDKRIDRVMTKNTKDGSAHEVLCQGVFIFVGITPNTDFLKNILHLDDGGFIMTDCDLRTSRQGIFACGDCVKKNLYQVVNACGDGAVAAAGAHRYLLEMR